MSKQPDDSSLEQASAAPIDSVRLERIETRLTSDDRFRTVRTDPALAPNRVICLYDLGFYPDTIQNARLEIV